MSRSLKGRVNNLELKVLGPVTDESAMLSYETLPKPDQMLLDAVNNLKGRDPESLTEYERKLCVTALERLNERTLRLFLKYIQSYICEDDPIAAWMFFGWFSWFMNEARHGVWQFLRENEIYDQKGKSWKQKKKEADEFCKKHWRHNLFSRERFEKASEEWIKATDLTKKRKVKQNG